MKSIAIIGCGAIGESVARHLAKHDDLRIRVAVVEAGTESRAHEVFGEGVEIVDEPNAIETHIDVAADCAGHAALRQHGAAILSAGIDLVTVSSGALADAALYDTLAKAATDSGSRLRVVPGAIGALDVLSAARIGALYRVVYRGRKPPQGWRGSAAEAKIDLDSLAEPTVHFRGDARTAALEYPKNANVAASVALSGLGFDDTTVELIADPRIERNIHEIEAEGDFGRYQFRIEARPLADNPRSAAIAAMSVVREIIRLSSPIVV